MIEATIFQEFLFLANVASNVKNSEFGFDEKRFMIALLCS